MNEDFEFWCHVSIFRAENTHKKEDFFSWNQCPNNPKKLYNFEKVKKSTFLTRKWTKMTPQNCQNVHISERIFFVLCVTYKPFELKKHKNSPFKLKDSARILPKTTSKQLWRPQKWPKHGCQRGKKFRYFGQFSIYEFYLWLGGTKKNHSPWELMTFKRKMKKND